MKFIRSTGVGAALAGLAAALAPAHAQQAGWQPERAIEFVVPAAAGGLNDLTMRTLQRVLQSLKLVTVPISITNKEHWAASPVRLCFNRRGGTVIARSGQARRGDPGDPRDCFVALFPAMTLLGSSTRSSS